jgi:predicted dehydrogenase
MSEPISRRTFIGTAAAAGAALSVSTSFAAETPASEKLVVGVMGTGGRGTSLAQNFSRQAGVTVAYVCDVDVKRAESAAAAVEKATKDAAKSGGKAPQAVQHYQKILDDKGVNVLVVATCNHWHAPAAILGCAAGKHVYVEKPCSHNAREGELLVEAARKHKRAVQMGNQRRSWDKVIEACQLVREGAIGRAYLAQSWYTNNRPSIGKGKEGPAPEGLDYELWQGPAPRRAFRSNYLHYNWHWFWNWGNGELGNNGIHMIDLCRWGLGVDFPTRVTSSGGRYRYEDDQETPDTHSVHFEFADRKTITWEGMSCNQMPNGQPADVIFYGENGSIAIRGGGYTIYDVKGKELRKATGKAGDVEHVANFLAACRGSAKLNSEIEEGHRSTLLCHLGNIAHRTGRSLRCDPKSGHIVDDKEATALWTREYAKGYEPKV